MTRNVCVVSQWSGGSIAVWSLRELKLGGKGLRGALLHAKLNASSALRVDHKRVYHLLRLCLKMRWQVPFPLKLGSSFS